MSEGRAISLTEAQARERLEQYGPNAIPRARRNLALEFVSRFWGPVPWVLEATLLLTLASGRYGDGVAIGFLLCFNAAVAAMQEGKARHAVDLLRSRVTVRARVNRDGLWSVRPAEDLVPGDVIHLGAGDVVPADVRLDTGSLEADQSVLTGESVPRAVHVSETAYAGTTVTTGDAVGIVAATGIRTSYGKTAELVRIAQSPGQLERVVLRFVSILSIVSIAVIAAIAVFAWHFGFGIVDVVVFAVMILLASVPIALPAAFTLATTLGSLDLARKGALITRLSALEDAASMDVLCTDKTGTITQNRVTVQDCVVFAPFDPDGVAALAAGASDDAGQDPVDLAVLRYAGSVHAARLARTQFTPFQPAIKYSSARLAWKGENAIAYKGSPPVLRQMAGAMPREYEGEVARLASTGARVIAVAVKSGDELQLAGLIALADPPRADAAALVERLRQLGIRMLLLTGDALPTALHVAGQVGIPASAVRASIYPADKLEIIRGLQGERHVVGMTGDGINDAPALRQASIGIAVSSATDIAKAAAGIVLTEPGLSNIVSAIESSRAIFERMITYATVKLIKYFEIVGVLTVAFFVTRQFLLTPELMVALLIFNDFVTLAISTDNVKASQALDVWRIGRLIAGVLPIAIVTAASVLLCVAYARYDLHLPAAQLRGVTFLALVLMGQIAVYIVRDRTAAFGTLPSRWLLAASAGAVVAVLLMAALGLLMPRLPLGVLESIVLLTLAGGAVLAACKLVVFRRVPCDNTSGG